MPRMVKCVKLGREAEGLDFPPYPGELGKRIFENVSKEAWKQWLEHQKMLVNENRLNLADKKARDYLAQQMENHFFGSGADVAAGYVPRRNRSRHGRQYTSHPPRSSCTRSRARWSWCSRTAAGSS